MKKLEIVFDNIRYGSEFVLTQDKYKEIYGTEIRYEGDLIDDMLSVNINGFTKVFPHLVKEINGNKIYRLRYNSSNKEYESIITDTNNNIIERTTSNDLYESIIEIDVNHSNVFNKIKRKIKTKLKKVS